MTPFMTPDGDAFIDPQCVIGITPSTARPGECVILYSVNDKLCIHLLCTDSPAGMHSRLDTLLSGAAP